MTRLRPGKTLIQGKPGSLELVEVKVPEWWQVPEELPPSGAAVADEEDVRSAQEAGMAWAGYELMSRELGQRVVAHGALPGREQPDGQLLDLRLQHALHHLVAAELYERNF